MPDYVPYRRSAWNRVWLSLVTGVVILAGGVLLLVAWWLFYPYQGLTQYTVTLTTPVVEQGGMLRGEIDYCVGVSVPRPIRIDREVILQNHVIAFAVPDLQFIVTNRCEHKSRMLLIPTGAPPGLYHLEVTTSIEVSPLRVIRQSWRTAEFRVVAKESQ